MNAKGAKTKLTFLSLFKVLTGEPSFFTVCAKTASYVACLSRQVVFDIMSVQPDVTLHLAASVTEHMSSFVRSIGRSSIIFLALECIQQKKRKSIDAISYP